ncbi:hypothetical protein MRB53_041751 [Persea americana]|nr:hypothetical protein MRB53_041751 [Persea americana]
MLPRPDCTPRMRGFVHTARDTAPARLECAWYTSQYIDYPPELFGAYSILIVLRNPIPQHVKETPTCSVHCLLLVSYRYISVLLQRSWILMQDVLKSGELIFVTGKLRCLTAFRSIETPIP